MILLLALACTPVEPLDLPEDPAATGVPVGVRTVEHRGVTFEVWYPARERAAEGEPEVVDLGDFVPQAFFDHVGDVDLPLLPTRALRDAEPRRTDGPLPVVLFSHGFGGFRLQSVDLTTHLASRGYIVLAPDHPGRRLADVLPCLFSPPLAGCDLSGFVNDPGPDDLEDAAHWALSLPAEDPLAPWVDRERLGLLGHSAGGRSVGALGERDDRVGAVVALAMGPTVDRAVPLLGIAGACDGVVPLADVSAGILASADPTLVTLAGAGHLAFTDLCALDLAGLAEEVLEGRDDLDATFYATLLDLGTDGCPGATPEPDTCDAEAFLDLERGAHILRHDLTVFFDHALRGTGPGVQPGVFEEATVQ